MSQSLIAIKRTKLTSTGLSDPPEILSRTDALFTIPRQCARAALKTYETEIGIYHSPVMFDGLLSQLDNLLESDEPASSHLNPPITAPWSDHRDLAIAKLILACGLEANGERWLGSQLFESTSRTLDVALNSLRPTLKSVLLFSVAVSKAQQV